MGSQSERHHYFYRLAQTNARVSRSCAGQMEREVHEVLGPVGVSGKVSRQVADDLLIHHGPENESKDSGISMFFLKFGEGEATLHISLHHRRGLPHRRPHSSLSLPFHSQCESCIILVLHRHRHNPASLRRRKNIFHGRERWIRRLPGIVLAVNHAA